MLPWRNHTGNTSMPTASPEALAPPAQANPFIGDFPDPPDPLISTHMPLTKHTLLKGHPLAPVESLCQVDMSMTGNWPSHIWRCLRIKHRHAFKGSKIEPQHAWRVWRASVSMIIHITGVGGIFVFYAARLSGPVLGPRTRDSVENTFFYYFLYFCYMKMVSNSSVNTTNRFF